MNDIRVTNALQKYNIDIETSKIYNVILVGTAENLAHITSDNLIAQVDASNITVQKGAQNVPAQIIVTNSNNVFATGKYMVLVNISTK